MHGFRNHVAWKDFVPLLISRGSKPCIFFKNNHIFTEFCSFVENSILFKKYMQKFLSYFFFFFFFFFLINFCWTHVHLWGHWYPCFGLLVTSPLGFKARVGSALFELCGGVRDIDLRSLRFTSGATHLPVYNASIAASRLPHMRISAEVGCRDLNRRPPARQSDALPTRPRRLAHFSVTW